MPDLAHRRGHRIKCAQCQAVALSIWRGKLYVEHRHHGALHLTIIPLADLLRYVDEEPLAV